MVRTFKYVEPADDGVTPVEVLVTEEAIRREYWPVWEKRMTELKRTPIFEHCVEDFCAVHWADEVIDEPWEPDEQIWELGGGSYTTRGPKA